MEADLKMEDILMAGGAAKLLDQCLAVQEGDRVVIVTDTNKVSIAHILAFCLIERNCDLSIHIMTPRSRHGEEPPASIAAAMLEATAILMPTTYSLTHTRARREANKKGAKILSLPGYTEDMLVLGGIEADFQAIHEEVLRVAEMLDQAEKAHITSPLGTDFVASIKGRKSVYATGIADQPGTWAAPPGIEAAIAPIEGSSKGTVLVDGVLLPGGPVQDEVKIEFDEGKITRISGGPQAYEFEKMLREYNDPNVYCVVEIGIGLNRKARLGRNFLEDESAYGTLHLGLGNGTTFGSSITATAHVDVVLAHATLKLDDRIIVRDQDTFF